MSDIAIKAENLSKVYKLYNKPTDRLKESINPFRKKYHKDFYALKDVSFTVKAGSTLGVIGKNGSGKSTLLKLLTGILTQTSGTLVIDGRVAAILELGGGFNPEYTGIENIYLNSSLMGIARKETAQHLNKIVEFADIGEFINQPVKTYSSGMLVRLAFSLFINVNPDILIIDEALSVGDMSFQKKCMSKINEFKEQGKSIVFCSHDMHAVSELCDSVAWMKDGIIQEYGYPANIISSYVSYMTQPEISTYSSSDIVSANPNFYVRNSEEVIISEIRLFDKTGIERNTFITGEDLIFDVQYNAPLGIEEPNYSVILFRRDKTPVGIAKTNFDKSLPTRGFVKGQSKFRVVMENIPLNRGVYTFGISIWDKAKMISFANNITQEFEIKSLNIIYGPTEEKCAFFIDTQWEY